MKKNKINLWMIFLMLLVVVLPNSIKAQRIEFSDMKSQYLKFMQPIKENNVVKGYYSYFFVEKESRKENHYQLRIFDNNLKETHSVDMVKPKDVYMGSGTFNGSHFCFIYGSVKNYSQELVLFDLNGKETGKYTFKNTKEEGVAVSYSFETPADETIFPIPNKGFAVIKYDKKTKGSKSTVMFIDNSGEKMWETKPLKPTEKTFDSQTIIMADEEAIAIYSTTREKAMSTKGAEYFLDFYASDNGEKIGDVKLNATKYALVPFGATKVSGEIIVHGEYYMRNRKGVADLKNKIGFFINKYDTEGELISEKYSDWEKEIKPNLPDDPDIKKDNKLSIFIHEIVPTADGKYYAIGEQYRKVVSGKAVALNTLNAALGAATGSYQGSGASNLQVNFYNMMIFEFDKDLNVKNIELIDKEKSNVILPAGWGVIQADKLGYMMNMYGWFDYLYTTQNSDNTNFNSVYLNYDRKGKGSRFVIGNITLNDDNKAETVKINLETNPTNFVALPAKPGYIAVFEYFKKTKSAVLRLEKLDI